MDKELNTNSENINKEADELKAEELSKETQSDTSINKEEAKEEIKELAPEEKIKELEDKVARAFAEMENQRRRFEKEKDDAFDYGGFSFAKEALSLIDNLERSRQILELEDKVARAFAEMENQRRRFEKEKEDAFNYGGFAFAKETLNLIDN